MKKLPENLKNKDGFTITEVIVSIGLGILLFGLTTGFYLFFVKSSTFALEKTAKKIEINYFFDVINIKFHNSSYFKVNLTKTKQEVIFETGSKLSFYKNCITYNKDSVLTNLESTEIKILPVNETVRKQLMQKQEYESSEIKKIEFTINKSFLFNYYVPKFSIKGLKNTYRNN